MSTLDSTIAHVPKKFHKPFLRDFVEDLQHFGEMIPLATIGPCLPWGSTQPLDIVTGICCQRLSKNMRSLCFIIIVERCTIHVLIMQQISKSKKKN